MKRALIYFIYDGEGIVDDYIYYAIDCLRPFVSHLITVVNGKLQEHCKAELEIRSDQLIQRDNTGFDVWAYKTAIDSIGWEALETYDELALVNYTIMGPVYDLSDMFTEMDKRDVDFWGITKCFETREPEAQKMWQNPYGYIPEHIQSSFCVFRKSLFTTNVFHDLWDNMPATNSYQEAGGTYEQVITKKFGDLGFKWDCYTDFSTLDEKIYGCCPLITSPLTVIKDLYSPFFKRRSFFTSKFESPSTVPHLRDFWEFIKNETDYDTAMAMRNLIRTCNQRDIVESLLLTNVVDENVKQSLKKGDSRVAIFVNTEHIAQLQELRQVLVQYDSFCDIFYGAEGNLNESSLCTGVDADYSDYDYIIVINPDQASENESDWIYTVRQSFYIFGLVSNKNVLISALSLLEKDDTIGLLSFPIDYTRSANWEQYEGWGDYFYIAKKWAEQSNLKIPLNIDRPPVAPHGAYIIRTAALKNLPRIPFYGEFIGYAIALICQHNKYLPQYVIPKFYLINNCFGYETYTTWIPSVLKVKQEYYKQLSQYKKEKIDYLEQTCDDLRNRLDESCRSNETLNDNLQQMHLSCNALHMEIHEVKQSNSLLQNEMYEVKHANSLIQNELLESKHTNSIMLNELSDAQQKSNTLCDKLSHTQQSYDLLANDLAVTKQSNNALQNDITAIHNSRSWRFIKQAGRIRRLFTLNRKKEIS